MQAPNAKDPPFPTNGKNLKYIVADDVWTDGESVWDDNHEYQMTYADYIEIRGSEWADVSELLYDLIGKTQEYRISSKPWEDPSCWYILSQKVSKDESVPSEYKLVIKESEEEEEVVCVTMMHRELGPVWSVSERITFPASSLELGDTITALQDDIYNLELLTHGCRSCWATTRFDKAGEVAAEYGINRQYVEDVLAAIANGEISPKFIGPIEPHCPVCDGKGIDH